MNSYLSSDELREIGFATWGNGVQVSRYARFYGAVNISLGDFARIDDFCVVSASAAVTIGRNVHIAAYCGLFGANGIDMGDFSGLSSRVTIYSASEDYSGLSLTNPTVPDRFRSLETGLVSVGRHAIVGTGAVILPGVTIGDGAAIGALSLVNRSLPEWMVSAGIPARPVKPRARDLLNLERTYLEQDP